MASILSLDVGTKTIGVARAYTDGPRIATPMTTLKRRSVKKDAAALAILCTKHSAAAIVVGLPLEEDGNEGRAVRLARQVGDALGALTGLPIHYQDERYSTLEASRRLSEQGLDTRRQRSVIDQAAAAVILEDWLVAQN
ncbi:MAG: putative Holliday junction resolvase [Myxococcota bacterium]|jgi:putative Holliday junction resolvase